MEEKARLESQLKLYKKMAVPTAIHGSDTWIVRKHHEASIQTAEMKLLREIAGYTSKDHI
jgi:hypothetical protein